MDFSKTKTKFGIYNIDRDFLLFLKTKSKNVIDASECDTYCGPVLTVRNTNFYVPVLPEQKLKNILLDFAKGKLSCLDFNSMIPCQTKHLKESNKNFPQKSFCLNNRKLIEKCAKRQFQKRS